MICRVLDQLTYSKVVGILTTISPITLLAIV